MRKILGAMLAINLTATLSLADPAVDNLIDLDKIVVTSSRMAQYDYKVAGNVTVIKRSDIEASNAQNIPEVLQEALGVHVVDNSTVKTTALDIRGFGDTASRNVLVLVNDRILNTVDISAPDLTQIPLNAVERIEIIRGAGSVLYGDRAVGGVVNIITKKGNGNLKGRLGTRIGSYDRRQTDLEVSGAKNKFNYFFYSNYNDDHGYRQNSDVLSKDFNTRLGYDLSKKLGVDVDYSYHEDQSGFPGALSGANLSALGPRASTHLNDYGNSKDNNLKLGLNVLPWPEDFYGGSFGIDLYFRDRDVSDSFAGFDTSRGIHTTGITTKYIFDHNLFNREFHFVTGLDFYDTENTIIGSGTNTDDLTISKRDIGIFGFTEYEVFNRLFLNAGVRQYNADYAFSQRNGVCVDEKKNPGIFVYAGGLKYEYAKGSNVHLNVQKTFRFLATDEWYSSFTGTLATHLNQQKGLQYEVGLKHNFRDAITVMVTPYLMDIEDEIFFDPTTFENSNYDKTRRWGVEAGGETDLLKLIRLGFLDKLNLSASYVFQRPQFRGGASDGKNIPLTPRQQFKSGLLAQFLKNYQFSLYTNYIGSQFAINDLSNIGSKVKPYLTVDGKLSARIKSFEIYTAVNNIFNQRYSTIVIGAGPQNFYPAPGRNFNLGVNYRF